MSPNEPMTVQQMAEYQKTLTQEQRNAINANIGREQPWKQTFNPSLADGSTSVPYLPAGTDPKTPTDLDTQTHIKMVGPDDKVIALPFADAANGYLQGQLKFLPKTVVNIVDQNGATHGIDESQLKLALQQGYQLETPSQKDMRLHLEKTQGLGGAFNVGASQFLNQATFGVAGEIAAHTDTELERSYKEAEAKQHNIANIAGGAAGFGASLLYGGEFGKAAEGIESAGRAALGIGERAALKTAPKAVSKIVEGAIAGGLYSAPVAATKAYYGDYKEAAETLGLGMAVGGGLAGTFEVGGLIGKAAAKQVVKAVDYGVGELAESLQASSGKITEPIPAFINKAAQAQGRLNQLVDDIQTAQNAGLEMPRSSQSSSVYRKFFATAQAKVSALNSKISQAVSEIDAANPRGVFNPTKALTEIERSGRVAPTLQSELEKLADKAAKNGAELVSLRDAKAFRDGMAEELLNPAHKSQLAMNRESMQLLNLQLDLAVQNAGKDLPALESYMQSSKATSAIDNILSYADQAQTTFKTTPLEKSIVKSYLANALFGENIPSIALLTGHPLLAIAGLGSGLIKKALMSDMSKDIALQALERSGDFLRRSAAGESSASISKIGSLLNSPNAVAGQTANHLAQFVGHSSGSKTDDYQNVQAVLAHYQTNSTDVQNAIGKQAKIIAGPDPQAQQAYVDHFNAFYSYLANAFKAQQYAAALTPADQKKRGKGSVSDADVAKGNRIMGAALTPLIIVQKLAVGTLTKDEVDTVKNLYPAYFKKLQIAVKAQTKDLPYADRLKLSLLFDTSLDNSLANTASYQQNFGKATANNQPSGGGGSNVNLEGLDLSSKMQKLEDKNA